MEKTNEMDRKKFAVYVSCMVIVCIAVVSIVYVIVNAPTDVCGHEFSVVEKVEPTYDNAGKIVKKCDKCGHEEIETLDKLEASVINFKGLELTFGEYSFTEVDNMFSEYDKHIVVKIPVTVKNVSSSPNSLTIFEYTLFGTNGIESADVGY